MNPLFISAGPIEWGSSRMRVFWVAQHLENAKIILADEVTQREDVPPDHDVYIFQKYGFPDIMRRLRREGKLVVWDLCDPSWWFDPREAGQVAEVCDAIVFSNRGLMEDFTEWRNGEYGLERKANLHTIIDRVDMTHFPKQRKHAPVDPVRLIWFGVQQNRNALFGSVANLDRLVANGYNISLTLFDNGNVDDLGGAKFPVYFTPWELRKENDVLASHDIALLPPYPGPWGKVKSNNKLVTAWACGLAVDDATDYSQLKLLVKDHEQRALNADGWHKTVIESYRSEQSAGEWRELLKSYESTLSTYIYSDRKVVQRPEGVEFTIGTEVNKQAFLNSIDALEIKEVAEIHAAIAQLGKGEYVPGSSATPGWTYNPIPFPEFADVPCHRPEASLQKWDIINDMTDSWAGLTVLDVGASVGYFSFQVAKRGAGWVSTLEHDPHASKVIEMIASLYHLDVVNVGPYRKDLKNLSGSLASEFDVCFALSVLMWLGEEEATKFLCWAAEHVSMLWIEMALNGDGRSGASWLNSRMDTMAWLTVNTDYKNIRIMGATKGPSDIERALILCTQEEEERIDPPIELSYRTYQANVYRRRMGNRLFWVAKPEHEHPHLAEAWRLCKERLRDNPHFPHVYSIGRNALGELVVEMEYIEGVTLADGHIEALSVQGKEIKNSLRNANIYHRDITPRHIIVKPDGTWVLIDFGWACDFDHPYDVPDSVGWFEGDATYKGPSDDWSMNKILDDRALVTLR